VADEKPTQIRICAFCGVRFRPRSNRGSPQRFHSQTCRHQYSALARRLGLLTIQSNLVAPKAIQASGLAIQKAVPSRG
jgi:hypothetical protein